MGELSVKDAERTAYNFLSLGNVDSIEIAVENNRNVYNTALKTLNACRKEDPDADILYRALVRFG